MCHLSHFVCDLSHITNATSNSNGPSPCYLPKYAQQDTPTDLDLDPSTMSCEDSKINIFLRNHFQPFLGQNFML